MTKPKLVFFFGRWCCGHFTVRAGVMNGGSDLDGYGPTPAIAYQRWKDNQADHAVWLKAKTDSDDWSKKLSMMSDGLIPVPVERSFWQLYGRDIAFISGTVLFMAAMVAIVVASVLFSRG